MNQNLIDAGYAGVKVTLKSDGEPAMKALKRPAAATSVLKRPAAAARASMPGDEVYKVSLTKAEFLASSRTGLVSSAYHCAKTAAKRAGYDHETASLFARSCFKNMGELCDRFLKKGIGRK